MTVEQKLYIFDFDDTLHNSYVDSKKSEKIKIIISNLKKDGHLLAVASFNSGVQSRLHYLNLDYYFDVVIGVYPYAKPKRITKPMLIEDIMEKLNFKNKEKIVFYDDQWLNIHEAKEFGIEAILVRPSELIIEHFGHMFDQVDETEIIDQVDETGIIDQVDGAKVVDGGVAKNIGEQTLKYI
jgi:HAD superfamily phosphatase (TIGR01681 family)